MELGGAGCNWVKVDRAGWRWVHGLVIPIINLEKIKLYIHIWFLFVTEGVKFNHFE